MEYEKFKLQRVDGFTKIESIYDAEIFLNKVFVKGDLFLTVNGKYTVLYRKDDKGGLKGYRKEANVFDESVEYEEMTLEQSVRSLYRMKNMFNKKLFRRNLY